MTRSRNCTSFSVPATIEVAWWKRKRALRSAERSFPARNNAVAADCTKPCAWVFTIIGSARMKL